MEKTKEPKAITLIALTITIVILLILAGITIATLFENNGILTKVNEAKNKTNQASVEENINLFTPVCKQVSIRFVVLTVLFI